MGESEGAKEMVNVLGVGELVVHDVRDEGEFEVILMLLEETRFNLEIVEDVDEELVVGVVVVSGRVANSLADLLEI